MATGYEGYAALGEMLSGGGRSTGAAYVDQLGKAHRAQEAGYDRDRAMHEARTAQLRAIAREGITTQNLEAAGYEQNLAPLLQALLGSAATPDLDQLGKLQVPGAGGAFADADEALRAGKIGDYNALTSLAQGKVHEPFDLAAGGKAVFNPATGEVELTALGDALVGESNAKASAATTRAAAAAERDSARARIYDRTDPNRNKAKPKSTEKKPVAGAAPAAERVPPAKMLEDARAAIAAGAPADKVRERLIKAGYPNIAGRL